MSFEIADYSEFQGVVHPTGQQAVIIRAHNGTRADTDFVANRAAAHAAGCPAVGLYQYLDAGIDAATQARELVALVGTLAPNEWLIADLEVGGGDQRGRWQAWDQVVVAAFRRPAWLYSGSAFAAAHNLVPDWVAAYQTHGPATPHKLWQNTDVYPWPWGKADGSVYDGTLAEFLTAAGITGAIPVTAASVPAPTVTYPPTTIPGSLLMSIEFSTTTGSDGTAYVPVTIPAGCTKILGGWVDVADPTAFDPARHDGDVTPANPDGVVCAPAVGGKGFPAGEQRLRVTGGIPDHFYTGRAIVG